MKKFFNRDYRSVLYLVSLLLCVFCNPLKAEVLDRIVAVVNDEIILYSDLRAEIAFIKRNSPRPIPLPQSVLEREVLRQMVEEKLVEQEMKRLKIKVDESEVDAAVESIKQSNGWSDDQFEYVLKQQGMSIDDFRKEIRRELERSRLMERVFQSRTVITDDQIEEYLREHGGQLSSGRVNLSIIFIPSEERVNKTAEDILREIQKGADFYELARKYSKGPAADQGGRVGWMSLDELAEPIKEAVSGLSPGQVSEVISLDAGDFIVRLEERETYSPGTITERDREKIRRLLFNQEVNKKFKEWMQDLMKRSYVKIML
ncbi:peptidylprolyl isomerase [Thermodesulforhabdus norvegica]|uniref:Periplasmic chaperone for outer membrane proteins SurA n=1 Tax=Thermodesulforhabdus norvegica TaxID=39841 RepID=A0A1I4RI43_9BACT|nr:SurA N-terminal domain-containing protein [Thermodesulforhabdus norvegica]SFM51887.1 periplasmic chaperone for outer membrane proteins SurA [Thermodesulforhabdus norvegica]